MLIESFRIGFIIGNLAPKGDTTPFLSDSAIHVRLREISYQFSILYPYPQRPAAHFLCIDSEKIVKDIAYYGRCRLAHSYTRGIQDLAFLNSPGLKLSLFERRLGKPERSLEAVVRISADKVFILSFRYYVVLIYQATVVVVAIDSDNTVHDLVKIDFKEMPVRPFSSPSIPADRICLPEEEFLSLSTATAS